MTQLGSKFPSLITAPKIIMAVTIVYFHLVEITNGPDENYDENWVSRIREEEIRYC